MEDKNFNYVYAFQTSKYRCFVVLYYNDETNINDKKFEKMKDVIRQQCVFGSGEYCESGVSGYSAIVYECDIELYHSMKRIPTCETFKKFFARYGFEIVFEYPFIKEAIK